jgi:N-acylglucosamine 2-epimerase
MERFRDWADRYETELLESVIPFWENHCIDSEYGGYFTHLDRDGSVYDTEKFMWMQWRIVYMFATLYKTRYSKPEWLEIARQGYSFLTRHGKDAEGNYCFALNRAGVPSICAYNIYSECFAAMGSAALYQATGEELYKVEAVASMNRYLVRLDNPKGRWNKRLEGTRPRLSLGHYMMLANLGALMNEALGDARYMDAMGTAYDKVMNQFWNPELRIIFENVSPDGSFDLESCDGRFVNPGHGLEALWFLLQSAETFQTGWDLDRIVDRILAQLEFGWDSEHGGIFYFMDALGKPCYELQADMKLWWVHNEALLAILFGYRLTRRKELLDWFERLNSWTWDRFPDPEYGEWYAYLNRRGEPANRLKGGRWKTFFHLPRFLLFGIEQLRGTKTH